MQATEHHGQALASVIGSWIVTFASFVSDAMPILQGLSLLAATVASIYAAIYYRARKRAA